MDNVHAGHRSRLKERFSEQGLDSFNDLNALELILFYAIPRGDVNPLAHALLDRFGSLSAVMDASEEDLMQLPGIGRNTAVLLKLIPQLGRRYLIDLNGEKPVLDSYSKAGEYLIPFFMNAKEEKYCLVCLDAKLKVIRLEMIDQGGIASVEVNIRKLVEVALKYKAVSVIIAHNHPSGSAMPSAQDISITRRIRLAFRMVDIDLSDHFVIAGNRYVSMAKNGVLSE